jgi:hypothetical protein
MGDPIAVDLFVEDRAHEEFIRPMINRLASEERRAVTIQVRSARGGHGRALEELSLYQKAVSAGGMTMPEILVVATDTNCSRPGLPRKAVARRIEPDFRDRIVVACPDPHIERWYLADPDSFVTVVGIRPKLGRRKCERGRYKAILSRAVTNAGHPATLGGIEFAAELVEVMDLFRAGKTERTLKDFVQDLRRVMRRLGRGASRPGAQQGEER